MKLTFSHLSGATCTILVMLFFVVSNSAGQTDPPSTKKAQNVLWDAAISGDLEALEQAINDGADVNALDIRRSRNGRRPLNWAAWYNHSEAITLLLDSGAEIDGMNITGFTPIHHAAEAGSPEAARVLIEAGADVNLPSYAGQTPLQRARIAGHKEVVDLLEAVEKESPNN
ncbi:MAG: ankyrin repeat domain-containing protein [Bacteroidetes bacterium]|nr:MAG: ankyrin repeat domain-containing protein [Bacteroidota bacterium]